MRILHLTPELPMFPGGSGGAPRQFQLLRRLAERGHDVAVVAPATAEQHARLPDLLAVGVQTYVLQRSRTAPRKPCARSLLIRRSLRQPPQRRCSPGKHLSSGARSRSRARRRVPAPARRSHRRARPCSDLGARHRPRRPSSPDAAERRLDLLRAARTGGRGLSRGDVSRRGASLPALRHEDPCEVRPARLRIGQRPGRAQSSYWEADRGHPQRRRYVDVRPAAASMRAAEPCLHSDVEPPTEQRGHRLVRPPGVATTSGDPTRDLARDRRSRPAARGRSTRQRPTDNGDGRRPRHRAVFSATLQSRSFRSSRRRYATQGSRSLCLRSSDRVDADGRRGASC